MWYRKNKPGIIFAEKIDSDMIYIDDEQIEEHLAKIKETPIVSSDKMDILQNRIDFLEDCIAEMAQIVYS